MDTENQDQAVQIASAMTVKAVGALHIPKKKGDVGYDIAATERTFCPKNHVSMVPVGVNLQMPDDIWCTIVGRSSMNKRGILVLQGTIDSGYTGPLFATVMPTQGDVWIDKGERIAQVIFMDAIRPEIEVCESVDEFEETERGNTGFGSTGR